MALSRLHLIVNALLFQVCWFLAILADWYWALLSLGALALHAQYTCLTRPLTGRLLLIVILGIGLDSVWLNLSFVDFPQGTTLLIPLWLMILWFGFVLTLPSSLGWLVQKPVWFVLSCALMGPVSYAAGRRLGALSFEDVHLAVLSLQWGVLACLVLVLLKQQQAHNIPMNLKKRYDPSHC